MAKYKIRNVFVLSNCGCDLRPKTKKKGRKLFTVILSGTLKKQRNID